MDENMNLRSYLLAVKLFRPASAFGTVGGVVLMKWVVQVLAQHGLRPSHFAGAVSDAGSDVSTGVGKAFPREWCFPHMLNRATIDATGMANSALRSKNAECRALVQDVKTVVEHFNRSGNAKVFSIPCFVCYCRWYSADVFSNYLIGDLALPCALCVCCCQCLCVRLVVYL